MVGQKTSKSERGRRGGREKKKEADGDGDGSNFVGQQRRRIRTGRAIDRLDQCPTLGGKPARPAAVAALNQGGV